MKTPASYLFSLHVEVFAHELLEGGTCFSTNIAQLYSLDSFKEVIVF